MARISRMEPFFLFLCALSASARVGLKPVRKILKNSRRAAEQRRENPSFLIRAIREIRGSISLLFMETVKKTYLTSVYLTRVPTNKIKGFVLQRNPFREAVENWPLLLEWRDEKASAVAATVVAD
jgi:hypothetical protein